MSGRQYSVSVRIGAQDNASGVLGRITGRLDSLKGRSGPVTGALRGISGGLRGVAASAGVAAGALLGIQGALAIPALVGGIFQMGLALERGKTGFINLFDTMEEGQRAMQMAEDMALRLPMAYQAITGSMIYMKSQGMDPLNGSFEGLLNYALKMGKSPDEFEGIIRALGQMRGKSQLMAEEMEQLAERGVAPWQLLSKATGKSVKELRALSKDGALGIKTIELLEKAIIDKGKGGATEALKTLGGQIVVFQNAIKPLVDDLFGLGEKGTEDTGLFGQLRDDLAGLNAQMQTPEFKQGVKDFGVALKDTYTFLRNSTQFLISHKDAVLQLAAAVVVLKASYSGLNFPTGGGGGGGAGDTGGPLVSAGGKGKYTPGTAGDYTMTGGLTRQRGLKGVLGGLKGLPGKAMGGLKGLASLKGVGGAVMQGLRLGGNIAGRAGSFIKGVGPLGWALGGLSLAGAVASGDKRQMGSATGGLVGSVLGGALGSFLGPLGTVIGSALGGLGGEKLGGFIASALAKKPPKKDNLNVTVTVKGTPTQVDVTHRGDKQAAVSTSRVTPAMGPMRTKPAA